jgi:hypothetical protein
MIVNSENFNRIKVFHEIRDYGAYRVSPKTYLRMRITISNLHSVPFQAILQTAQVPPLPELEHTEALAASNRGRPRQALGGVAMDAIQATFGQALLLLAGLATFLLAIIFVLLEANLILHLGGKLTERLRSNDMNSQRSRPIAKDKAQKERVSEERGR